VRVISIDGESMTLEDYSADFVDGVKPLARFSIAPTADIKGADSIFEIKEGDMISIEYYTASEKKKVIDFISVDQIKDEEEIDILLEDI